MLDSSNLHKKILSTGSFLIGDRVCNAVVGPTADAIADELGSFLRKTHPPDPGSAILPISSFLTPIGIAGLSLKALIFCVAFQVVGVSVRSSASLCFCGICIARCL